MKVAAFLLSLSISAVSLGADPPPPANLHDIVSFEQLLGAQLPLHTRFLDTSGQVVALSDIARNKPVLLAMGYYRCPNLCTAMLSAMAQAVAKTGLEVGRDFAVVFIGIDPKETASEVREARETLQRQVPQADLGRWHLLLGDEPAIHNVANAVGYRYIYEPRIEQYIHPSGLVVANADGVVSQYLFGVGYSPASLRLALVDASAGRLGSFVDQLVLLCSGYDPQNGRYSIVISKVLRLLALVTTVFLVAFIFYLQRRPRRGGSV